MDSKTIIAEVSSWPAEDRFRLIDEIWEGLLDEGHEPALTAAQITEIERRVADDDANPDDVVPGEEVIASALKRAGR
jgi:putative addiction module component (TIGR02574 family)